MNKQLSTSINWPQDAIPKHWVESLFEKMLFEYGKKFSDQWGGADAEGLKIHWATRLADLSGEELKRGVQALAGRDWPPTLPEFRKLCRPPIEPMTAYYVAVSEIQARDRGEMGEWPHPAVYWAAVKIGAFDLKNQSYSQIRARWESALEAEMAKGEWSAIPEPMAALPAPGKGELSKEKAAELIQKLGADGIIKQPEVEKVDHKLWAKRIMERENRHDPTLSALQVRFAKEALEMKQA
jgi:hypothetical protein